ncbi:MAG TPA: erythromycin esterase family protein [Ilumatobacteraceae bacterium]
MSNVSELDEITRLARALPDPSGFDPLIERIGDARCVLVGEASHGTAEFYRWRAELTKRLIAERGFSFVAVEGDWPDCFDVNCWVKDRAARGDTADAVLARVERWPTWMWANTEVAEFVDWLRDHNRRTGKVVGFYGLDVYSLWESIERILRYLHEEHPDELPAAKEALMCFEPYAEDPQRYAHATRFVPEGCEREVIDLLGDLRRLTRADRGASEADFDALQNSEVVAGAERYYRTMIRSDNESWNVRDCHMADTLDRLMAHHGPTSKAVVWEHNTHVGDARATDMALAGMINVGQLVRERHRDDGVVLVGFSSFDGSVIAASGWGAPTRQMDVPAGRSDSHEALLHEVGSTEPLLLVFPPDRSGAWLSARRGHRAIGVVYDPHRDRHGNWVPTVMGGRYDALIHIDRTTALHPLHAVPTGEEQETYPWAV